MASKPLPYTVEIPLKRKDRAEACPEVDRCQLKVEVHEKPQALAVVDTGMGTRAVQVKLKREGKGCDATVSVGLIEQSGYPVAVGDDGGLWEHRLDRCIQPNSTLLDHRPRHLLNVRYADGAMGGNGFVSLIVYQDQDDNWQVVVERVGARPSILRLSYQSAHDDLVVTAALSQNLEALYVTESRKLTSNRTTNWYWYTWSRYTGSWVLYQSGLVPTHEYDIALGLAHRVNRDGHIHGYWGVETTTRKEYDNVGGNCPVSWAGKIMAATYKDYSTVWGGYWSILSKGYTAGRSRCKGVSLREGDMGLVGESYNRYSCPVSYSYQEWSHYEPQKMTYQELTANADEYYTIAIGGQGIGQSSKDYGVNTHRSGRFGGSYDPPVGGGLHEVDYNYTWPSWSWHDGVIGMVCTPGGWITLDEAATVRHADLSPYSWHVSSADAPDGFCLWPLSWMDANAEARITETNINRKTIVYPHGVGECISVFGSFMASDQQTGITYAGVLVQAVADGPQEWHIYRQDALVTNQVQRCIARPLDQLDAIYWRA